MFGPGHGHNVESKLKSLKDTSLFEVVFVAYKFDESFRQKYPYIKYIPSKFIISKRHLFQSLKSLWHLYKQVRHTGHYDVVYSLGMGGAAGALFFFLSRKETKRALEIWSNHILDNASNPCSFIQKLEKYMIKHADFICQYWWGIRERFIELFPEYESKFLMYNLTYPDIYFSNDRHKPESDFVRAFLEKIPDNQIVCFWPRSFIPSNNHPLLLDSLGIINKKNPMLLDNFKLYLWGGNVQKESQVHLIEHSIKKNQLIGHVEIVEHPFVPQNDIFAIEERSDFFVQIAKDDILSTFIMEILCSGKPYVLSNLRTFQFLNEKYDLNVDLTENEEEAIAAKIECILFDIQKSRTRKNNTMREKCRIFFSEEIAKPASQILYEKL